MLKGALDAWPLAKMSLPQFIESYGSKAFQVSKPGGGKLKMDLAAYGDYMLRQHDEEPLYVFDAAFAEAAPELMDMYSVPRVFDQDFTAVLGGLMPNLKSFESSTPATSIKCRESLRKQPALDAVAVPGSWDGEQTS